MNPSVSGGEFKRKLNMKEYSRSRDSKKLTGINQKQLWHYAKGISKPRQEQRRKIENALHKLGSELVSLSL